MWDEYVVFSNAAFIALVSGGGSARSGVADCEFAGVALDAVVLDVAGAVCGAGMMSCSPGRKIARWDRSFAARRLLTGMPNDCAMPLSVSPACTV